MTAPMRIDGVDISHHQGGKLDLAKAKKAGVKWLYHKATEGATYKDPNYDKRRKEAKAAGIPFGAYHFARASVGDAAKEAKHFLDYAKPKPGDLRPALDLETTEGLTLAQLRTWAKVFIAAVHKATGVHPIVYTPFDLGTVDDKCIIWRPRYNDSNRPPVLKWDIWQFSNGQLGVPDQVPGLGRVDINTMRSGLKVSQLLIPKPSAPPAPAPSKKVAKLRFAHASMQFSDSTAQQKHDVDLLFARGYDVITGTEAGHGSGKLLDLLEAAVKQRGYLLSKPGRYDTWVAVKASIALNHKTGAVHAVDRSSRQDPEPAGRWGDKGVVWLSWDMGPTFGKFAVGAVHNLTWGGAGVELKNETDIAYAKAMKKWADALPTEVSAFIGGDFNRRDRDNDLFRGIAPFQTCWDDLKVWPNTGHGNIDALARHKADARVRCVGARVLDDGDLFLNTDHFLVEAEYEVRAL